MEAVILVDVLRRAGAEVLLASVEPQLEIRVSLGTKIVADDSICSCSNVIFDLVALPVSNWSLQFSFDGANSLEGRNARVHTAVRLRSPQNNYEQTS